MAVKKEVRKVKKADVAELAREMDAIELVKYDYKSKGKDRWSPKGRYTGVIADSESAAPVVSPSYKAKKGGKKGGKKANACDVCDDYEDTPYTDTEVWVGKLTGAFQQVRKDIEALKAQITGG